jgi:hypothetical protein
MLQKPFCFPRRWITCIIVIIFCLAGICLSESLNGKPNLQDSPALAGYTWSPDRPPTGRNAPYISSYENFYCLKLNKYMEGYVDLGEGKDKNLKLTGPMTLTAVIQLAKQWPMKAALISKWDFMESQASYELGINAQRQIYLMISEDGLYDGKITEITTEKIIDYEKPLVVCGVFEPGRKISIYINGELCGNKTSEVARSCFDGTAEVKIGPRFEGLIAGVWFHDWALTGEQIKNWSQKLEKIIPEGIAYDKWERLKRNVPRDEPAFLGTTAGMKLVKEIDITPYVGSYVCPGDLNNDGRLDFLLYKNGSTYTVPGRLTAIDFDGNLLWQKGDLKLSEHEKSGTADVGQKGTTPALRGIAAVYDIDQDGSSEVITELWEDKQPMLYILDGGTGDVKQRIKSPISMEIRQPPYKLNRQPSRSHPVIRIARINGADEPPCIILKYGASNGIPCHAFALDDSLNVLWHIAGTANSMGHIPTAADVDEDGKDEIVLGHMLADHDGTVLWDKGEEFGWHADATAAADVLPNPGKEIFISVCGTGPLYCLSAAGDMMWSRPREQVEHGQALWVADFIEDNPGKEVIALVSGHVGRFYTFDAATGRTLAYFEHKKLMPAYPDFPAVVNWEKGGRQSLWIPQDRILVDGYGRVEAELGDMDEYVAKQIRCGTSWRPVGAQAFALDICGDEREELILYEPYEGRSIFIFSNPDSDTEIKPWKPQENAYNIRSYF